MSTQGAAATGMGMALTEGYARTVVEYSALEGNDRAEQTPALTGPIAGLASVSGKPRGVAARGNYCREIR